jgi:hypothetical protein
MSILPELLIKNKKKNDEIKKTCIFALLIIIMDEMINILKSKYEDLHKKELLMCEKNIALRKLVQPLRKFWKMF